MKNPRTEITNESAKFVLHAYRPNGADAQDPIFRAALEQAARDPELGAWLKEQRAFDSLIAGKLAEFQPPATLYSAILAGIANRSPTRRFTLRPLLALAAVLILSGAILLPFYLENRSKSKLIEQFQRANLTMLSSTPVPQLDLVTADFSRTQEYLAEMKAPASLPCPIRCWIFPPPDVRRFVGEAMSCLSLVFDFPVENCSMFSSSMRRRFAQSRSVTDSRTWMDGTSNASESRDAY